MRWNIESSVKYNSFDYFEKTLITENGFREYDVRWLVGKEVNPNGFLVLGKAYGTLARNVLKEDRVVVGHDFRSYSQDLMRSLIVGLMSTGVHVIDVGLALSPMVYFAQHHFNCRAAMMVTASHNENGWSGLKIANGLSSTLEPDGILQFKNIVYGGEYVSGKGSYEAFDGLYEAYTNDILKGGKLKKPIKVVVAAGNGTGGRFAPGVFRALGCEVIEVDCTPDWNFPNHNPNPEDISFLHGISAAVKANKADLGIGIDGDGDRIGVVDRDGEEIFSDKLGLIIARQICKGHSGRPVVVDVKSTGLYLQDPILKENNTPVILWKTGHSYIKAKVRESNALAGFEKSGHWFFSQPYGRGYDDAILSAAVLLRALDESGKTLDQLEDEIPVTWQSPTYSPFCADAEKYDVVDRVAEMYRKIKDAGEPVAGRKIVDLITVNGVRFVLDDTSWGLVRASSNKPCLAVVAESRVSEDHLRQILDHIRVRLDETQKVGEYDQALPGEPSAAHA